MRFLYARPCISLRIGATYASKLGKVGGTQKVVFKTNEVKNQKKLNVTITRWQDKLPNFAKEMNYEHNPVNTQRLTNNAFLLSKLSDNVLKEMIHALAVRLSSYGCTWEVGRQLEKLEKY